MANHESSNRDLLDSISKIEKNSHESFAVIEHERAPL